MSYEDTIIAARNKMQSMEVQLRIAKFELSQILVKCPHEWKKAPKGYEHEGNFCKFCGVSDLTIKG